MAAPFPSPTEKWHSQPQPATSPSLSQLSARGKTILITGGGSGIGAATAHSFAEAGASRIVLLGRRNQPLVDTKADIERKFANVEVLVQATDVTKKEEVDAAFQNLIGNGKVDVLVSNAATTGATEAIKDVDGDKFIEAVEVNLRGALFVAQAFLKYAANPAVAISTSSSAAHLDFAAEFAAYSTAKMAVVRLWQSFAFANPHIAVFSVQPGVIDTAMNREAGGVAAVGFEDSVFLPANFYVWLASPEAKFLRGKFLWANWDVEELKSRAKELEESQQLTIGLVGWPFGDPKWTSMWKQSE